MKHGPNYSYTEGRTLSFFPPPKDGSDFKELFQTVTSAGAGRPINSEGFSSGPWTPELLTEAIVLVDPAGRGTDLRTVQHWFQKNERGISAENIPFLAQVFGCNDPKATSLWQVELSLAQSRLQTKRRLKRRSTTTTSPDRLTEAEGYQGTLKQAHNSNSASSHSKLAIWTESQFSKSPLNLSSLVFSGAIMLVMSSIFMGIHSIDLISMNNFPKQVGFMWAPNWTILFMVLMPAFIAQTSALLIFWKKDARDKITDARHQSSDWHYMMAKLSNTYWTVLVVCLLFAGFFQWVTIRLLPLLNGDSKTAVDWGAITVIYPDIISLGATLAFTAVAYMYMGVCFYIFFSGLILIYTTITDGRIFLESYNYNISNEPEHPLYKIQQKIILHTFICSIIGVSIAISMKLQTCYLSSNSSNIIAWLIDDLKGALASNSIYTYNAEYITPTNFSSLVVVLSVSFVFFYGVSQLSIDKKSLKPFSEVVIVFLVFVFSYATI